MSPSGVPQNKPVGYRYNAQLGTIDIAGYDMEDSAKYRNVGVNPHVAFVVYDAIGKKSRKISVSTPWSCG